MATTLRSDEESLLSFGDDALLSEIMPVLVGLEEEYSTVEERFTLSSPGYIEIPTRAFNGTIRRVQWREGTTSSPVAVDRAPYHDESYGGWTIVGDKVTLQNLSSGYLDVAYPFRPGSLVTSDNYRIVASVDTGTNTVTFTENVPDSWLSTNLYDIIDADRSGTPRYWDLAASTVSGTDITFTTEIAGTTFGRTAVAAGNMVMIAGYAGRPMVPESLHMPLCQAIVMKIAQATNDTEAFKMAQAQYSLKLRESLALLSNRAVVRQKIVNKSSPFRRDYIISKRFLR